VIALLLLLVLLVGGGVVTLHDYHRFRPRLVGGASTPTTPLKADHWYTLAVRYTLASGPGVRIDAIHVPTVAGLDLSVTGVRCGAAVAQHPVTEGPNLGNGAYAPKLGPKEYFAQITRPIYGYKVGTPRNPAVCAVLAVHSKNAATYHLSALRLDWRAGLFVGSVHDQTDATLTFS
jgi:hypothetical protein